MIMKRLRAGIYWWAGGTVALGLLFFLWHPLFFKDGFSPGRGVRDRMIAGLPWLEPGIRRILFLPELSKYEKLEITAGGDEELARRIYQGEWKNLLVSNINPLRYAELWLNRRALTGKIRLEQELSRKKLQDVRVSAVARLRPETENYDDKIAIIELASVGMSPPPVMTRLKAEFGAAPGGAVVLSREGGAAIGELKPVVKGNVEEMEIEGLNEPIDGRAKYRLNFQSPLPLTGVKIWISNGVTGNKAGSVEARFVDEGTYRYIAESMAPPAEFAANNREFLIQDSNLISGDEKPTALLPPGKYLFNRVVVIPATVKLRILPGVTLRFAPGASLVSYAGVIAEGTASAPIRFISANGKPWGVFAVVNAKENRSYLRYVAVEDGAPVSINGMDFSGGFSAHYSDIDIYDSEFRRNHGDDGVNLKYSQVIVKNSRFIGNDFDGLDLDAVDGLIRGNEFSDNGNDGLDVSWNKAAIENNVMRGNKDKCLSVGEKSTAAIKNNSMKNCAIGIAVKDSSDVEITGNRIEGNKQGIAVYQKKEIFGGGIVRLGGNEFAGNGEDIFEDLQSEAAK